MTGLHREKQGAQHPETDSSVEGGVYGALTLISPQFVRPFVKGNKNDFIDAEAICEAASRPTMRFVTPKTEAQQTLSVLHRMRESLVRDRTKTANQAHGFLLEFGISLPKGLSLVRRLPCTLGEHELPPRLATLLKRLHEHFCYLDEQIRALTRKWTTSLPLTIWVAAC